MTSQNFSIVAKEIGEYSAANNQLLVRKGRKIYRFTCGEGVFRFTPPSQSEIVFLVAPDAKVDELRRCIADLLDSQKQKRNLARHH